jgi:dipeptidase
MKTNLFLVFLLLCISLTSHAQSSFNCYTIAAGKNATTTGHVMLLHNEDDHGNNYLNFHKTKPKLAADYTLKNGGQFTCMLPQLPVFWIEMPGQDFADVLINDAGVMIVSNACPSREDKPELTDGGIGWMLRQITARHASSAKMAVKFAGDLIEKFGYASSGRTYTIADKDAIWVMSVVNGKHWVAQRVPDNEIMVIANYYTIGEINLKDSTQFMASPGLIDYAQQRGWHLPEKDGAFNFREAYGKPESLAHIGNIARQWQGINLLSDETFPVQNAFPFSFKPGKKFKLEDFMRVLENHYEGNEFDDSRHYRCGNPHSSGINSICSDINQFAIAAEFREDIPQQMGNLCWIAFRKPCIQPFVPFFTGVNRFPDVFSTVPTQKAMELHFKPVAPKDLRGNHFLPGFHDFSAYADDDYSKLIEEISAKKARRESDYRRQTEQLITNFRDANQNNMEELRHALHDFTPDIIRALLSDIQSEMRDETIKRN